MNKYLLLLPLLVLASPVAAQHGELAGRAGLGLFNFGGTDAVNTSHVNYQSYNGTESGYTNSPYGHRLGTGFSLGARAQHVGKRNGLLAFDLGYDWLRSRTNINTVDLNNGQSNTPRPADGHTNLQTQNLTAFVGIGHRVVLPAIELDVLVGPEIAYLFGFHERGSGTYDGDKTWKTDSDRSSSIAVDARLRADATAWYGRTGFNVSYSYGFINYQGHLYGGSREVYSRTLRLGLAHRLK